MNKDDLQALDLSEHFFSFHSLAKMYVAIAFITVAFIIQIVIESHKKESDNVINVLSKTLFILEPIHSYYATKTKEGS